MMSKRELEEESFAAAEVFCYHFINIPPSEDEVMVGKSTIEEKYYTSTFDDPVLLDFFLNLPQDAD
eukprot:scaffold2173_cov66-Skeletonema_dohrnii-CCMP3373.AAC.1